MEINVISLISILILLGGRFVNSYEENFDEETIEKAKSTVESYLINNFKDIDSVKFKNDYSHPMGGMNVRSTVNNDGEFSMSIDPETFDVQGMSLKVILVKDLPN